MFTRIMVVAGALVILVGCGEVEMEKPAAMKTKKMAMSDVSSKLKNEAEFRAKIVGRQLTSSKAQLLFKADGTYTGVWKGKDMYGKWWFKDNGYCRSATVGNRELSDKCQNIYFGKGTVTIGDAGVTYNIGK